jgi:excinuclease ABC subunit C
VPRRGQKVKLLEMALENAREQLREWESAASGRRRLLSRLQRRLSMERLPLRIECFDNSNLFGDTAVASMVVFEEGRPNPSAYRRFRIRTVAGPDDYASMAEVLGRRFGGRLDRDPKPDLLIVDGGKGQLNIARRVIDDIAPGSPVHLVGIAKKAASRGESQDKVYLAGRQNPLNFGRDADLLLFLQRIRDEAHRFAISYHRHRRRKEGVRSELDPIPGVGDKRKKALLRHFGGVEALRQASVEEIAAVPGMNPAVAESVKAFLADGGGRAPSPEASETAGKAAPKKRLRISKKPPAG